MFHKSDFPVKQKMANLTISATVNILIYLSFVIFVSHHRDAPLPSSHKDNIDKLKHFEGH